MLYDCSSYQNNSLYKNKNRTNFMNLGNTCYLNAVLCCLVNCLGLTEFLLTNKYLKTIGPHNKEKPEYSYLIKYIQILVFYYNKNHTLSPKSFLNDLFIFCPFIKKDEQNDAHECLLSILNILHIALSNKLVVGPIDNKLHKKLVLANKEWIKNFKDDYSIINHLFFGQYIQKIKCLKCNKSSYKYDPFVNLSLGFPDKEILTIYDLLNNHFKKQELEMKCEDNCKEITNFTKKLRILKLPKYLIIHFKRFNRDSSKIQKMIGFSSELDMSNYSLVVDKQSVNYNLISVINHAGSSQYGHYYSNVRTFEGNWVKIDDNRTTDLNPLDVCSKNAYLLIYELDCF